MKRLHSCPKKIRKNASASPRGPDMPPHHVGMGVSWEGGFEWYYLITVHRHSLGVAAQFPVCGRTDGPASRVAACAALLQRKKLLRTESLVMNLACRFNQILKVCTREEVTEIDEFAVVFIFNVNHSPAVLATPDLLAIHDDGFFASNDGKWDNILDSVSHKSGFLVLTWIVTLICALTARSSSSSSSLSYGYILRLWKANSSLILALNSWRSSRVRESDFAMTGTTLTTSESFLRTTISIGFNL